MCIRDRITTLSPEEVLNDPETPQGKAFAWILSHGEGVDAHLTSTLPEMPLRLSERYALAVLYYALRGDEWNEKGAFLTGQPQCYWSDVMFDCKLGFVTGLYLGEWMFECIVSFDWQYAFQHSSPTRRRIPLLSLLQTITTSTEQFPMNSSFLPNWNKSISKEILSSKEVFQKRWVTWLEGARFLTCWGTFWNTVEVSIFSEEEKHYFGYFEDNKSKMSLGQVWLDLLRIILDQSRSFIFSEKEKQYFGYFEDNKSKMSLSQVRVTQSSTWS